MDARLSAVDLPMLAEAIVQVEVKIESAQDLDRLEALGYSCDEAPACHLQVPQRVLPSLAEAGWEVVILAKAIRVSNKSRDVSASAVRASALEQYQFGSNYADVPIPDYSGSCGEAYSDIPISGAPAGVTVTRVTYSLQITHTYVGDLTVSLQNCESGRAGSIWTRAGGATDGGYDSDTADDADIEIYNWTFNTTFDGDLVNTTWRLYADDCATEHTGYIDLWEIYVFYEDVATPTWTPTSTPTPTPTPTNTPTIMPTPSWTPTNAPPDTPTPTRTPTRTPTDTLTPTQMPTNMLTNTPTWTPMDTPTLPQTPTNAPTRSPTTGIPTTTVTHPPTETRAPTPTGRPASVVHLPIAIRNRQSAPAATPSGSSCRGPANNPPRGACGPLMAGQMYYEFNSSNSDRLGWFSFYLSTPRAVEAWLTSVPQVCD